MAKIKCVKCDSDNTKCTNDMLQMGYIAETYECQDCKGLIEVVYKSKNMVTKNIKSYRYLA